MCYLGQPLKLFCERLTHSLYVVLGFIPGTQSHMLHLVLFPWTLGINPRVTRGCLLLSAVFIPDRNSRQHILADPRNNIDMGINDFGDVVAQGCPHHHRYFTAV